MINEFFGDGSGKVVKWTGSNLRPIQTGRIQQYMMLSLVVMVVVGGALVYYLHQLGLFKERTMNFIATHLLSLILFFPALAAVVMLFLPSG